ncbi:pyridoxamine 5'-phosphate oxidase family protein [Roseibium album]|uniref:pyridoxamine 5'-phosphate oxidase family protein n=1 Tax=Roseibium album TaxID=311410 RepID=UPI003BAE3603
MTFQAGAHLPDNLKTIERDAWKALESATLDRDLPYRYLTLASLGRCDFPEARTVVLRSVDRAGHRLEFHTDTRSPKWQEFHRNGDATVLGYSNRTRVQLRLRGSIQLSHPGSDQTEMAWNQLPSHTRSTYAGGPPGDELPTRPLVSGKNAEPEVHATGKQCFGVLFFKAASLDWCRLERQNNLRARFIYDDNGDLEFSNWIAP